MTGRDSIHDRMKAPMIMSRLTTAITSQTGKWLVKPGTELDADEQDLVGDGVEIGAKFGVPAEALGKKAIGRIGETRKQKQHEGRRHLMGDD